MVEALIALLGSGLPARELEADPFGADAVRAFRGRLSTACREVHGLIAPRLRQTRGKNVRKIEEGLAILTGRLAEAGVIPVGTLKERAAELLPHNLQRHLHECARERNETDLFRDVLDE